MQNLSKINELDYVTKISSLPEVELEKLTQEFKNQLKLQVSRKKFIPRAKSSIFWKLYNWLGSIFFRKKPSKVILIGSSSQVKTLTASYLAKVFGRDVYRIDLSMVVSKYIGEIEKQLSQVMEQVENLEIILNFDKADSLFDKRTDISDAHDRFSTTSIDRIRSLFENYKGMIILSSNQREILEQIFIPSIWTYIQLPNLKENEKEGKLANTL